MQKPLQLPGLTEFVILVALLSSLTALAIDGMLPALPEIGRELGVSHDNQPQLVLSVLFLGLALGQLFIGPLSDSMGRKPLIYGGLSLFGFGCLLSMFATDFNTMLIGRFLQGLGAASPRIITMALVRDCYRGREMARIMSLTQLIFILVPMLAPALGQGVMWLSGWRAIFTSFLLLAVGIVLWFGLRMPETLPEDKRTKLTWSGQLLAIRSVMSHRQTIGYTVMTGFVFAAFLGYLNSSQQILQQQYQLGPQFPLYFALLAFAIGAAGFANAKLVLKYGMKRLVTIAIVTTIILAAGFILIALLYQGHPPFWWFIVYVALTFVSVGILFGNLNALAMEPLEIHAGMGASIIGSLSTFMSIPLGTMVGLWYDETVIPLVTGFLVFGLLAYLTMWLTERSEKQQ
ncbi:MAG: multidrug effflux MFS transporter [Thiolinea sp.]